MNIQEIKRAILELSPKELAQFRKWYEEFENKHAHEEPIEDRLKRLRGSLKGTGAMKAFLAEKKREREL